MPNNQQVKIKEALSILVDLGMPAAQRNERSALCLLAIVNVTPDAAWTSASNPLIGITPIMDWVRHHYEKDYAPNTRETIRRQTMHQFIEGGIALYNPDKPSRPVNSPHAVYQIEPGCLTLVRSFGTAQYKSLLTTYSAGRQSLAAQNAMHRMMEMVPLYLGDGMKVSLSPGDHSALIRAVWEEFGPRFVPGGKLVYAGDTGDKWGYFDKGLAASIGLTVDNHGKMPDVVILYPERNWLVLVEAVTSHGPVDSKRHRELSQLFKGCQAGLVFISAFPDRRTFSRFHEVISWETDVWIADNPTHLIHFNGTRFLGPHK